MHVSHASNTEYVYLVAVNDVFCRHDSCESAGVRTFLITGFDAGTRSSNTPKNRPIIAEKPILVNVNTYKVTPILARTSVIFLLAIALARSAPWSKIRINSASSAKYSFIFVRRGDNQATVASAKSFLNSA